MSGTVSGGVKAQPFEYGSTEKMEQLLSEIKEKQDVK